MNVLELLENPAQYYGQQIILEGWLFTPLHGKYDASNWYVCADETLTERRVAWCFAYSMEQMLLQSESHREEGWNIFKKGNFDTLFQQIGILFPFHDDDTTLPLGFVTIESTFVESPQEHVSPEFHQLGLVDFQGAALIDVQHVKLIVSPYCEHFLSKSGFTLDDLDTYIPQQLPIQDSQSFRETYFETLGNKFRLEGYIAKHPIHHISYIDSIYCFVGSIFDLARGLAYFELDLPDEHPLFESFKLIVDVGGPRNRPLSYVHKAQIIGIPTVDDSNEGPITITDIESLAVFHDELTSQYVTLWKFPPKGTKSS